MGFVDANILFWMNYFTFSDRSSRSEYWYAMLGLLLLGVIAGFVAGVVAAMLKLQLPHLIGILVELAILIPMLALTSRRLHDVNRSFWWILISFVPIVGGILLLVWYCTKGTDGDNRFGPDPLA